MAQLQCITDAVQKRASADCARLGLAAGAAACALARQKICPSPDVAPVITRGASGIQTVGITEICQNRPIERAPYPPTQATTSEAAQTAALARLQTQAGAQSVAVMKLRSETARRMHPELGWGFWLGLGLVGAGGLLLYTRR